MLNDFFFSFKDIDNKDRKQFSAIRECFLKKKTQNKTRSCYFENRGIIILNCLTLSKSEKRFKKSASCAVCECAQSCLTLHNPMDCIPPCSSVHGFSRQEYWSGLPFPPPGDLQEVSSSSQMHVSFR